VNDIISTEEIVPRRVGKVFGSTIQGWICLNLPGDHTFLTLNNSRPRTFFARFAPTGQHFFLPPAHNLYFIGILSFYQGGSTPQTLHESSPGTIGIWQIAIRLVTTFACVDELSMIQPTH